MPFPQPRTHFVGRQQDLAHLADLCAGGAAIVTLWGPPGIGKTRLAIEFAAGGAVARAGRIVQAWFCDLAGARDAADVCAAVARELGPGGAAACPAPGWLALALGERGPGLVVLDNFEQVAAHAAET